MSARRPSRATPAGRAAREPRVVVETPRSGRSRPGDETSSVYAVGTTSSTSRTALKSRLTCAQSSTLTLSSALARRPRPVDLHAQHHAGRFAPELHVEDLESVAGRDVCGEGANPIDDVVFDVADIVRGP